MRLRPIIFSLIFLPLAAGLAWAPPREVICETTQHTYCPAKIEEAAAPLRSGSLFFSSRKFSAIERQARETVPELAALTFRRTPLWTIKVTAEISPEVFPLQIGDQRYLVRANGLVEPADSNAQPVIIFASPDDWLETDRRHLKNLDSAAIQRLSDLSGQFRSFSPRVTKIVFISPQEIRLYFDGKSPAVVRADEEQWLGRQLAALQAFFRSSTMTDTYQELDARFADLIVR